MTDELAPFFESRELRVNRLPEEARDKFSMAATAAREAGQTDFEDRQFVSLWLSRRTGMPRNDILNNFDAIASRFFGDGATPSKAWDAIAKSYAPPAEKQDAPKTGASSAEQEFADTEGLARMGRGVLLENTAQSARSVGAGFEEVAQQVPAGLFSQMATMRQMPKSPYENRTYLDLDRERRAILRPPFWPYDHDKEPTPAEAKRLAKIDADMAVLRDRTNEENRKRLADVEGIPGLSAEFRKTAKFWYELSGEASKRWGVNPDFEKTTMGQFMKSAGSVPATAALAVMGPAGGVGMQSMFFAQVEQERADKEGDAYDPVKAFGENQASAIPQMILERAFGVERLLNKVLGDMPKQAGKVAFGDFMRQFARQGLAAGVEEGITEPVQNFWNDYIASITYDQSRELFTPDALKQRAVESVSAFALGFLFGGGVTSLEAVDHNKRVTAGEKYLTTREGQTLTEHDFAVMRGVKSDQELMATAPDEETGRVLVAAANGDKTAQGAYNNRVMQSLFVKTEDVDVAGMSVGLVNDVPVIRMADGVIVPLDLTKEEDRAFLDNFKREAVKVKATQDTLAELQKRHGDTLEVSQPAKLATLEERVAAGQMTQEQANDALEVAKTINGLAKELTLADVAPEGSATTRQAGDVMKMVVEVAQSSDPTKAVEEVSEAYIQRAYRTQGLVPADLNDARLRWHQQNGETDAAAGFQGEALERANIEWFSKRVIDYALANRKTELPGGWGAWLRTLGEQLKKLLAGATRMKKLLRDGKVDPELEAWMKGALGMTGEGEAFARTADNAAARAEQGNREAAPVVSELDQEIMETALADQSFPKIEKNDAGSDFLVSAPGGRFLGSRPTIEQAQQMALEWFDRNAREEEQRVAKEEAGHTAGNELIRLVMEHGLPAPSVEPVFGGELRALRESLGTAKSLRIFRKNVKSLDGVREALNEDGFRFETIGDLLDALDRAARGEKLYGNQGGEEQVSFSLSRAKPADTSNVLRLPDDSHLVGPTTFAIAAWHGTPHKVDRFKLEAIGTGEGAAVYGWGLYFAQAKETAESYRKKLSAGNSAPISVLKQFFTPGRIIPSFGGKDRVIAFDPGKGDGFGWVVTVIAVDKDGKDIQGERPRRHTTHPSAKAIAAAGIKWEPGKLYGVDLLPSQEEFLDWDAPVTEQPPKVRKVLRALIEKWHAAAVASLEKAKREGGSPGWGELKDYVPTIASVEETERESHGWKIYKRLADDAGYGVEDPYMFASLTLLKEGIPGIRYLDQGSRQPNVVMDQLIRLRKANGGNGEAAVDAYLKSVYEPPASKAKMRESLIRQLETAETRNFVIFDDKLVKIISENGEPVAGTNEGATSEDLTFALTSVPQNSAQALQAQAQALRAKKLAATAQLAARLRSGTPLPARAALVRRTTQASLTARVAMPISSRLARIHQPIAQRLRRFEFDLAKATGRDFAQVEPFIRGFEKMKPDDARLLDLALKNGDTDTRDTILTAYNLTGEFNRVQALLDSTKARAIAAGYDFGEVQDYFPRKVNDVDGLFMHYYGKPQGGRIEEVLREAQKAAAAQGRTLTHDERVEIVNSVLRGFRPPESKPSNLKQRKTDIVDVDADRFYADSVQALASYIEQMNAAIARRQFFGKYAVTMQSATGGTYSSNKLALDASIGGIVEDMIAQKQITRAQQAEVQSILQARFGQESSSPFIRAFKSLSYMGTMGQITSAMSQLQDLAFSLYETGVYDTIVAGARAVTRTSKISRKELGLEGIAEEFRYQEGLHKALDRVFKLVGIHYLDMVGKETLVNARFAQLQRQAAAGKLDAKARELITTSFGPTIAPRVIGDLARGVKNEDTLFTTYSVLSDYQPLSLSEYPEFYLRHPNGRVFYMLKSFTLKQVDAFRREAFSLIVHGNAKQKATGFKNLIHLAGLLYIIGLPVDWLKDWVMGRDPQLGDLAVDNVFKLFGVNRWNLYQFRESKDPVQAALLLAAPPAPFLVYPLQDIANVAAQIAKGDEIKPGDFESWRMLPFVGSPIYWWFGGGATKVEEKKRKRERGRVNP